MADLVSEEEVPFNARGVVDQMVCSVAARYLCTSLGLSGSASACGHV